MGEIKEGHVGGGRMQALNMQMFGPGLSGLTSVPAKQEGAEQQRETDAPRDRGREGGGGVGLLSGSPGGLLREKH